MSVFYPREGQQWLAGLVRTALVNSEIHLYKDTLTPNEQTTLAELVAAEADFTGYAAEVIAAWNAVFQSPLGAAIQSPIVQFQVTAPVLVENSIGGAWLQTTGGVLVSIITFPAAIGMATVLNAIPISEILRYGSGL